MKITTEQLKIDIIRVSEKLHKPPSISEYNMHGIFNSCTIRRRLGSWNNVLMQLFSNINRTHNPVKSHPCSNCGQETKNPKFCSMSCAATINNSQFPKRHKRKHKCLKCGRSTVRDIPMCQKCFQNECIDAYGQKKLSDFKSTYARHRYTLVRAHAHRIASINNMEKVCPICNYSAHVELCHRIPISKFSKDALLKDINAPENLIFLCPNHHWEIEHGYRNAKTLLPILKLSKNNETGASSQA